MIAWMESYRSYRTDPKEAKHRKDKAVFDSRNALDTSAGTSRAGTRSRVP